MVPDLPLVVSTAFCKHQLAGVRALHRSIVRHRGQVELVAVLVDDPAGSLDLTGEDFEVLRAEDLLVADELARLDQAEDPDLVVAALARPLGEHLAGRRTIPLPPDSLVTGPLDPSQPDRGWMPADPDDEDHGELLAAHGHGAMSGIPYGRGLLGRDDYLGDLVRCAFVDFRASHPDRAHDHSELMAWLRTPRGAAPGGGNGVGRLLADMWKVRGDLQAQFPDLDGEDGPLLVEWAWEYGTANDRLPVAVLPDRPDASTLERPIERPPRPLLLRGVNVIGLLERELGLGEAARHIVTALDAAGVPLLPVDVPALLAPSRPSAVGSALQPHDAHFDVNLLCLNGEMTRPFADIVGDDVLTRRFTAALWFWEVGPPPDEWFDHVHLLDEIWVTSKLIADEVTEVSPVPVVVIPQPVEVQAAPPLDRARFGVDPDAFLFLFVFDHNSDLERKNPDGLIEAYIRAFPDPQGGTALLLKSINADRWPAARDVLRLAASRRPDIHFADERVEPEVRDSLLAGCDCYVSLHRSEGFGLTMAEAMLHERPVIASGYGGNLEFMDGDGGHLVDVAPTTVTDRSRYPEGGTWAEPDLDHAAALMRSVVEDPDTARKRAAAGADALRRRHSPAAVGAVLAEHLERGRASAADRPPLPVSVAEARAARMASAALAESRRQRRRLAQLEAEIRAAGGGGT